MIAEDIKIECEENGFHLVVDGERWLIADPEALYDHVKAQIGPWLHERELARDDAREWRDEYVVAVREDGSYRVELDEDAYDPTDPKSSGWHDRMSTIYDERAGK